MKKLILFIAILVSFNLHSQCADNHYEIINNTSPLTSFHVLIYDNNNNILAQVESDQSLVTIDLSASGTNTSDIVFIETVTQISGNSVYNSAGFGGGGSVTIPFPLKVYTMTEISSTLNCTREITIN